jgi:3-oxoacyl-[acyl-carrier-protein] synthase II
MCPIGNNQEQFWSNLTAGRSGIGPVTLFDASTFPVRIGGEVKRLDQKTIHNHFPESITVQDRKVLLALAAAEQAVTDSMLGKEDLKNAMLQCGVGLEFFQLEDLTTFIHQDRNGNQNAYSFLGTGRDGLWQTPLDRTAGILGRKWVFGAGRITNCSACAAGAQVIGEAWQELCEGRTHVALAGATDSMINPLGLGGFGLLRVLSDENDTPQQACRPFEASRKGTVLGEGSAFIVLETLEHAIERNAKIYAEIIGYGSSMDACSPTDPDSTGAGAAQSMKNALATADIRPESIDCINAHGTGTVKNDIAETTAIKQVLGNHAYEIPVHSVKSMTGHLIAASGTVEAIAAILTIRRNCVPPTINLTRVDTQCDLDYVPHQARIFSGDIVLSNSFGFGGQNATLIFRRFMK